MMQRSARLSAAGSSKPWGRRSIVDKSLRRGLVLSDGSLLPFCTRPISAALALLVVAMLLAQVPAVRRLFPSRPPAAGVTE